MNGILGTLSEASTEVIYSGGIFSALLLTHTQSTRVVCSFYFFKEVEATVAHWI